MPVKITDVDETASGFKNGIRAGHTLLKINGHEVADVLDYQFYVCEKALDLTLEDAQRGILEVRINREDEYEDIGLIFETYLMDKKHSCKNKCIFCFVDQLPKGMRESLYFKDDDERLSFLFGNYITLTNLTGSEVDRIIKMRISPVNISVHTMNPDLRVKMMHNKNAGKSLEFIPRLAQGGIKLNTQLVLCRGINDGDELVYSLNALARLYPSIQSIAIVPVGLTAHREGLFELLGYDEQSAASVIDIVEAFGNAFINQNGTRLAFCADEFYLKANRAIPPYAYYEDLNQLENGVGLWALLKKEFCDALDDAEIMHKNRKITMATGVSAYPLISALAAEACGKIKGLSVSVITIKNKYFGESINVAGLLTGTDLISQLKDRDLYDALLIPSVMLKQDEDVFLDDITLKQAEEELQIKITPVKNDGYELLNEILGGEA